MLVVIIGMHIHNEALLAFLRVNQDKPKVACLIREMGVSVRDLGYDSYFEYLEDNIGDDASFTMNELMELTEEE